MSVVPASVKCDGCGKDRVDDSNHWKSFNLFGGTVHIEEGIETESHEVHACGETCAMKLISRWFATGKLVE